MATALDAQGEIVLAGDVRYFAKQLPPVMTDGERLAADLMRFLNQRRTAQTPPDRSTRGRGIEFTR